jgi:hypothetical protein
VADRDHRERGELAHAVGSRRPVEHGRLAEHSRPVEHSHDVDAARRGVATFGGEWQRGGGRRAVGGFVAKYGWRAYALPILLVLTVAALLTAHNTVTTRSSGSDPGPNGAALNKAVPPPVASGNTALKSDAPGAGANDIALRSAALPPGAKYTTKGDGTFQVLKGTSKVVGSGHLFRYSVEVEKGITGVDVTQFDTLVQQTLADPRSWSGHGVSLQRVDSGTIDFHVSLTSVMTVRALCGYEIPVETSCYVPAGDSSPVNRVVLDVARWVRGSAAYVGDLNAYRVYMINHEDGHAMGHQHAHECLPGGLAPVMMQQTIGLTDPNSGKLCAANPWPYPPGAGGAPGAEQPDTPANSEFQINGD